MTEPRLLVRAPLDVLLLASLVAIGCAPSLFSSTSFRSDHAPPPLSMAELEAMSGAGPLRKATVLEVLGPPLYVIGQGDGEIFVYRRVARDSETLTLNPAYLTPVAPSIPVFSRKEVSGRDDVLMVFFDEQGEVRSMSAHRAVGD